MWRSSILRRTPPLAPRAPVALPAAAAALAGTGAAYAWTSSATASCAPTGNSVPAALGASPTLTPGADSGSGGTPVYRVAMTGGPCGGKSSSADHIKKTLEARGFAVFFVPEVPTLIMGGGAQYPGTDPENFDKLVAFEESIIRVQMQLEDAFLRIARSMGKPAVVCFDRGLLDIPAYMPRESWLSLLQAIGLDEKSFCGRYDVVLHLVTTAHGLEHVYAVQKANNPTRTETAEQARALDDKTFSCWSAHSNVAKISNDGSFADKLDAATAVVTDFIDCAQRARASRGRQLQHCSSGGNAAIGQEANYYGGYGGYGAAAS